MNWKNLERILCVRLDALGDVVMTEPAIRALKESNPGAWVTLLTSRAGAEAARLMESVDEVVVYEAPWMKATPRRSESSVDQMFISSLRTRRFDAAAIFTVYSQSPLPAAYFCSLAEIPLRLAHCREVPYQLLSEWVQEVEPDQTVRHEVRRQLDLVASVGCYTSDERIRLKVAGEARHRAEALLRSKGVEPNQPYLILHPGASAMSRRYSEDKFSKVIGLLKEAIGSPIVLTGTSSESEWIESIRVHAGVPTVSLAGELRLDEFAAVLSRASLLVSNNTGAVHVAAGVRTPVVDLYALTNPQHTPWMVANRVLFEDVSCRYCYKSVCPEKHNKCLQGISPQRVLAAAIGLLDEIGEWKGRVDIPRQVRSYSESEALRLPPSARPARVVPSGPVGFSSFGGAWE